MNKDNVYSECLSCEVISEYFVKNTVMDDSSDFQEKKKCKTGPKKVQKTEKNNTKKLKKKIKGQKDIRALIKKKDNDLVSFSKNFDQVCKENGVDVDSEQLQLAIALSKSLYEAETKHDEISEDKPLLSSQEKSAKIRLTLQEYGFKVAKSNSSTKPHRKINLDQGKRKKLNKQHKLLLVSNEEKQQNISDKYAEVLATNIHKSPSKNTKHCHNNHENLKNIFNKASNLLYEHMKDDKIFYVHELFEKHPFKLSLLRDWSEIPGRPVSPQKEVSNIIFDDIYCTQSELDCILSGSIHIAQDILKNKYISNKINVKETYTNHTEGTNILNESALQDIRRGSQSDLNFEKELNMESSFGNILTVTHKVRSVSPDIFDDDITLTADNTNNSIKNTHNNITKTYNNITDCMDLTECVSIIPLVNKKNLSIRRKNNTNLTNDLMDITECVATCSANIDLTQTCYLNNTADTTKYTDNDHHQTVYESYDHKSEDQTIIIDDNTDEKQANAEVLHNPAVIVLSCDRNKLRGNSNYGHLKIDLTQNSYNDDKLSRLSNTDNKRKRTLVNESVNIDTKSNIKNPQGVLSQKEQNSSFEQLQIDNIDLKENYIDLNKDTDKLKHEVKTIEIDLTHLYPNKPSKIDLGIENSQTSLDNTIVIDDIESKHADKDTSNEEKKSDVVLICDNDKLVKINDTNFVSTRDDTEHTVIKSLDQNCGSNEDNLNEINDCEENMELNLTSNNKFVVEKDFNKDKSLEKTTIMNINDTIPCSDITKKDKDKALCDDINIMEINKSDNYEKYNSSYVYDDYVYNNSLNYDYCDNNYSLAELDVEEAKVDHTENITEGPSCSNINVNQNVLEKIDDKANIEEPNIDLTQDSNSSKDTIEYQTNPITNLSKIDNISIDYDEMFDDVMSASSKSASKASITSNNVNKSDSINRLGSEASNKSSDFELSDKELNYSLHKSRHNFDIGGISVLDNVSDFTRSIKDNSSSRNLNRSLSDGCLPSVSSKGTSQTLKLAKINYVSETSTPHLKKDILKELEQTPKNHEYIIKTNNITPMMDYESMTSPERNRELEKYGLKPFKRKRAIQLLTHLYNQTHPIVQSCETEEFLSPSKKRKLNIEPKIYKSPQKFVKSPQKPMKSPRKLFTKLESEINKENVMYEVTKENPDVKELRCEPEDWVFQKREKAKVHSCKVPLHIAFHNYVSCRRFLREAILKYEPINIDVVHKDLVASGYRYNPKDLLKFMDKKCITVKTADNNTRNRKT